MSSCLHIKNFTDLTILLSSPESFKIIATKHSVFSLQTGRLSLLINNPDIHDHMLIESKNLLVILNAMDLYVVY